MYQRKASIMPRIILILNSLIDNIKKESIPIITWMVLADSKRRSYRRRMNSELTDEKISDSDYEHARTVWKTFKCNTIGDYHDLYLKTDV